MRAMQVTILAALMMRRSLCRMAAQFYHLGVGRSRWTLKNGEKRPFYTNKISRLALTLPIFDRFGKMGYQIDPLVKPDSKHSLLFLEGSILGPFTYLKGTVLKGHYSDPTVWPTRRYKKCGILSWIQWLHRGFLKTTATWCNLIPPIFYFLTNLDRFSVWFLNPGGS